MPASNRYVPKHRATKNRVLTDPKRLAALGATVPAALGATVAYGAPAQAATEENVDQAVDVARDQNGDPYEYGADGPDSFDCSGLVQFSYEKAGINMPRTSDDQAARADRIPKSEMQPGDLMFFDDGGGVYHVGIYTGRTHSGEFRILHSGNEGQRVRAEAVWTNDWFAGTVRR